MSELESIQSIPSRSSHGIMSNFCKGRFWPPSCEIFISSALGYSGLSDFSNDTTQKNLVSFRAVVLCQDLGIRDLAPVSHECTVSGLESIRAFPSESKHGKLTWHHVAYVACEGTLLWIQTKLPVHAPCLDWSRFGRSRQKANTASCSMYSS